MGRRNRHAAIYPYQCHTTAEDSWVMGIQVSVWYRQMYSTGRRRTEMVRAQTTALKDAEGLQAERGKHVTQLVWIWWIFSAVLKLGRSQSTCKRKCCFWFLRGKVWRKKSWQLFKGIFFHVINFHSVFRVQKKKSASKDGWRKTLICQTVMKLQSLQSSPKPRTTLS